MSSKLDYLKKCIISITPLENIDWYVKLLAVPVLTEEDVTKNPYNLKLITKPDGLYYLEQNEDVYNLIKINDYKINTPLFTFKDTLDVDSSWLPSIKGKLNTKLGTLVVNALCLYPVLKDKLEYINNEITVSNLNSIFISRVSNTPKESDISVKEMIGCIDRLYFLTNLSFLVSKATSEKVITKPPGIDSKKKQLIEEYKDDLTDPVKVVELEKKLEKFDLDYLEDDEVAGIISKSKKGKTARKKMYLMYGSTLSFDRDEKDTVITSSLDEGISTKPEDFHKYINDSRYGSYARGASTAMSGYAYKVLQRALSSVKISPIPCDTNKGILRYIDDKNKSKLINRYIKDGKWKLISSEKEASNYINKEVEIRSSMYCTSKGDTVCYACMSEPYKENETGVTNLSANISSVLMQTFLKLMHGVTTEVVMIEDKDLVS